MFGLLVLPILIFIVTNIVDGNLIKLKKSIRIEAEEIPYDTRKLYERSHVVFLLLLIVYVYVLYIGLHAFRSLVPWEFYNLSEITIPAILYVMLFSLIFVGQSSWYILLAVRWRYSNIWLGLVYPVVSILELLAVYYFVVVHIQEHISMGFMILGICMGVIGILLSVTAYLTTRE